MKLLEDAMKSSPAKILSAFVFANLLVAMVGIQAGYAASLVVNTSADNTIADGFCSLREAIINANNNSATYPDCAAGAGTDTISFAANYTITLIGSQLPVLASTIMINGSSNTLLQANTNRSMATYRLLEVANIGNLTIKNLRTALRLSRFLGNSPQFWRGLQSQYDLDITQDQLGKRLDREVRLYAMAR